MLQVAPNTNNSNTKWPGQAVPVVFSQTAAKFGSQVAIRHIVAKEGATETSSYDQRYQKVSYTWKEYEQASRDFAKALIAVGLEPGRGVTIQGSNSPKWLFANMGTLMTGGISAGVYPTNGPELSQHAVRNSSADVVVVEDEKQLQKYVGLNDTAVKCYVVWNKGNNSDIASTLNAPVYSWEEFIALGKRTQESELTSRIAQQTPDQVCALVYTSGTTDLPKAAALTHDNLIWTAKVSGEMFKLNEKNTGISYLPLSHVAAQMLDGVTPAVFGYAVEIAPADALKGGNLKHHLTHTNPTYFLAVPRVWEKFKEAMEENTKKLTGTKKKISNVRQWLLKDIEATHTKKGCFASVAKVRRAVDQFFLDAINKKILTAVGLQKCKIAASGAGAIDPKVVSYFKDYGIKIVDLYGLSETTGPTAISTYTTPAGSVGRALPGTQIKIANPDAEGKGEIRLKGRNIFQGYLNNPEATQKAFDEDGFFCTGDEGRLDDKGNLFITGRLKELIKTSGGENIPPVRIEERIKHELPILDQVVVIGDKRHFLTCLLTLQTELDQDGNPTDRLAPVVLDQLSTLGSSAKTIKEAQEDAQLQEFLMKGIKKANQLADSQAQNVQKFTILPENLSVANGMITPTQKMKRSVIEKHYTDQIEKMYQG